MRIVCYAINGSGVGHLVRLTAIARWFRYFAAQSNLPLEIFFLTSSEASGLLYKEGFASFKLPSRETLQQSDIESFIVLAKKWTFQTLEILKPDLLLVDTFPAGYYNELSEVLKLCRQTAFIHRSLKFTNLKKSEFDAAMLGYDLIVVPEVRKDFRMRIPKAIAHKTKFFGAIMNRERNEMFDRQTVRRLLNINSESFVVYITAGGGGDNESEKRIHYFYKTLAGCHNIHFVIGAGMLYQGSRIYAENVTWLSIENTFELMDGFDMAISAVGYNSFHELLFAGIPTIFIPQKKWADDQVKRAQIAAKENACILFETLPKPGQLKLLVEKWQTGDQLQLISKRAKTIVPTNYASEAAQYLFEKLFVLDSMPSRN